MIKVIDDDERVYILDKGEDDGFYGALDLSREEAYDLRNLLDEILQ